MLVREVIVEIDFLETPIGRCDGIYDAIALSLSGDHHERVAGLFEAARGRPAWKNMFDLVCVWFFCRYPPEKDNMPLKRFFTLHREEFSKNHPAIFGTISERLVWKLRFSLTIQPRRN